MLPVPPVPGSEPATAPHPRAHAPGVRASAVLVVVPDRLDQPARRFRRLLEAQLRELGLLTGEDGPCQRRAEEALLVAGELVGNAGRHSSGPTRLVSRWQPGPRRLTLCVSDPSAGAPRITAADARGAHGGYGLLMVEILCEHWTTVPDRESGKTVRATLDFPPRTPHPAPFPNEADCRPRPRNPR
ncbi:ATP-binding protein [Streptomyces sp. NPDC001594]|uniref:ATP-binding protein n=1 Tax=Streptomyces sp. NPDC001594 TaxID=3364590 RepID=UPI00368A9ADD